jgi:SAM-dependent methyltransferase
MRQSAVNDCMQVLSHFGVATDGGAAIDVGGTQTVCLDGQVGRNPLLDVHPGLLLLDEGFTQAALGTSADTSADFLDPAVVRGLEKRFDLVYTFDTLEHVANPFRFAEHLIAVTRPGGHLYVATVFQWMYHPSPEDYFRYSPTGLLELFRSPLNARRDECTVLWYGWGTDPKGTALLARRNGTRTTQTQREALCAAVPDLVGNAAETRA